MTTNPVKDRVQNEARTELIKNDGTGLIAIATGGGKSKIVIDYVKQLVEISADTKIMLVVPTVALRDTDWQDEFTKWGAGDIWENNVRKECYAYIEKIENQYYDQVILDELQHITPNNYKFFEQNEYKGVVGLSATPPKEKEKRELLDMLGMTTVYHVSLDDAVEIGLVSPYKLTLIEMDLNRTHSYVEAGGKKRKWMTTENRHYDYLTSSIKRALAMRTPAFKMKFRYLNRMRFIYNLKSKEIIAKHVLEKIISEDERTLIFTGSIASAEALCEKRYHSKMSGRDLTAFRNKEINRLSCVNALNEGVNIKNVDNAFVVQVNAKERRLIQRIGRILRYSEDHVGHIYLLYVKDTVDEKWMEEATKGLDKSNVKRIKMSTNGTK